MRFNLRGSFRSCFESIIDFIYPPLCVSCQRLLEHGQDSVCPDCWNSIQVATTESSLYRETREKIEASGVIDGLFSVYVFEKEGVFQQIVHQLKYAGAQSLGLELGRKLGAILVKGGIRADGIIPVPLHRRKLRERGYNQAELIARGVSHVSEIPIQSDLIFRKKYTKTQTVLSLNERRENMDDAFELASAGMSVVKNKTFVVIDDVVTTGSTMIACAAVLRAAGARRVIGASTALAE